MTTSVAVKPPCRVATTAAITLSGEQTVNGVAVVTGDRVLVKDQADTTTNGIYIADTSAWSRAPDFDGSLDAVDGTLVLVIGAAGNALLYELSATNPVIIGTSAMTFSLSSLTATAFAELLLACDDAQEVRDLIGAIGAAEIQAQTYTAFTTATSATAYTVVTDPVAPALAANQRFQLKFHLANTSTTPTLARDGLAAKALKVYNSAGVKSDPAVGEFALNMISDVVYDGTDYVVFTRLPVAAASETVAGKAELATQAEVDAGSDDARIVTPLKLRFGFSMSLTTNGYIAFPSWLGGFILQWYKDIVSRADGSNVAVTWPLAFPTACLSTVAVSRGIGSCTLHSSDPTTTGNTYYVRTAATDGFFAWALGY